MNGPRPHHQGAIPKRGKTRPPDKKKSSVEHDSSVQCVILERPILPSIYLSGRCFTEQVSRSQQTLSLMIVSVKSLCRRERQRETERTLLRRRSLRNQTNTQRRLTTQTPEPPDRHHPHCVKFDHKQQISRMNYQNKG